MSVVDVAIRALKRTIPVGARIRALKRTIPVGARIRGTGIARDARGLWTAKGPPGNDVSGLGLGTGRTVRRLAVSDAP